MADELSELKKTLASLQKEVGRLSDQEEIRKLQYKYGYYLDKCLYKEVVDLYADDPEAFVQFLGGRYKGKTGVARLYIGRFASRFVEGRNGPIHGFLLDHPQIQGIVDVNEEGTHAKGRFRSLMQAGVHTSIAKVHPRGFTQWWEGGIYENEYIKQDGVWKIFKLRYFPFWHADFEHGWSNKVDGFVPFDNETYPKSENGPDELVPQDQRMLWPDTRVVPFHYTHPITGKQVEDDDLKAPGIGEDIAKSKPALTLN